MPLTKRDISPVNLSQHRLPKNAQSEELQCIANGTLANLIRQLSSLSAHAEDVFGELYVEAVKVQHKVTLLSGRVESLDSKIANLDSMMDEPNINEFYLTKPFKSSSLVDQQSLSRHTLPTAIARRYERSDRPPQLEKLDCFREDGKRSLKFYTDPDFFFELWRNEMLKDPENIRKARMMGKSKSSSDRKFRQMEAMPSNWLCDAQVPAIRSVRGALESEYLFSSGSPAPYYYDSGLQSSRSVVSVDSKGSKVLSGGPSDPLSSCVQEEKSQFTMRLENGHAGSADFYAVGATQRLVSYAGAESRRCDYAFQTPYACSADEKGPFASSSSTVVYTNRQSPSRPLQPPPLPPLAKVPLCLELSAAERRSEAAQSDGDVVERMAEWNLETRPHRALDHPAASSEYYATDIGGRTSSSPDLPPPPPPLTSARGSLTVEVVAETFQSKGATQALGIGSPPPPPPPPPLIANGDVDKSNDVVPLAQEDVVKSTAIDTRSDLLKAIRQGIQLKKVNREQEKQREHDHAMASYDVAAILKRRMELIRGYSESEDSATEESDDWDD